MVRWSRGAHGAGCSVFAVIFSRRFPGGKQASVHPAHQAAAAVRQLAWRQQLPAHGPTTGRLGGGGLGRTQGGDGGGGEDGDGDGGAGGAGGVAAQFSPALVPTETIAVSVLPPRLKVHPLMKSEPPGTCISWFWPTVFQSSVLRDPDFWKWTWTRFSSVSSTEYVVTSIGAGTTLSLTPYRPGVSETRNERKRLPPVPVCALETQKEHGTMTVSTALSLAIPSLSARSVAVPLPEERKATSLSGIQPRV